METRAYRLHMLAPLHVGEQGVGKEATLAQLPSDTLFSALVVTWREMPAQRATATTIDTLFSGAPPLVVSSTFPFVGSVLLLPKPFLPLTPVAQEIGSAKKYKRVQWVSTEIFQTLVNGIDQAAFDQLWRTGVLLQGGTVWIAPGEQQTLQQDSELAEFDGHIWSVEQTPKVVIDRLSNASNLFHVGRTHFARGCGLWCLAQGEPAWLERTEAALQLMATVGVGGQRSRGSGQFRLEILTSPPTLGAAQGNARVLLSRLAPRLSDMALLRSATASYELVTVGGYIATPGAAPLIRCQVRMLTEGSLIGPGVGVPGYLVDVTPPVGALLSHPINRYGFGFTVPVLILGETELQ